MVSALTQRAADITLDALERGALDYVAKPDGAASVKDSLRDELLRKIRAVAGSDVRRLLRIRKERQAKRKTQPANRHTPGDRVPITTSNVADKCIVIGVSTGGPPALTSLFEAIQPPVPAIVVVQHMPGQFTAPFAARLDLISPLAIKQAVTGDVLKPNHVLIAPGGQHLYLQQRNGRVVARTRKGARVSGH